ncbi:HMG box protein [Diplocarpon rosae]|nr:HMG box protein [Diplocarpon rosae]
MTELATIFAELGISHYLHDFIDQGFDTWDTILDITESDFDALGVKLGHRRKLQRKIANTRGLSAEKALVSPRNTPTDDRNADDQKGAGAPAEGKDGPVVVPGAKRKYRRHPKPDENAPERPPSAYVIFSNKMREDLKGRNLSFTEIAKLVGENWQNLSPSEKDPYEQEAFGAKERYNHALAEYKKTEQYTEYSRYLAEFKARHSVQGSDTDASKRPKLEPTLSTTSSGSASNDNQHTHDSASGAVRTEPSTSNPAQWHPAESQPSPSPHLNNAPAPHVAPGPPSIHSAAPASTALPGYRDSIYPSLPWRDGQRDDSTGRYQPRPRRAGAQDGPESYSNGPPPGSLNLTGSQQFAHRTGQVQPPPLLTSESTNRSTASSASTASSVYYSPRTPLEPPLERSLPIPSPFSQKSHGSFESHLPPLRRLSPQSAVLGVPQPPSATSAVGGFQSPIPPFRSYASSASHLPGPRHIPDHRARDYNVSAVSADETVLDPVSALLRAGEIVNRNSRGRSNSNS